MSLLKVIRMLKARREAHGWTQMELADRTGLSQAYIASLEGGDRLKPSPLALARLVTALEIPVAEIPVGDEDGRMLAGLLLVEHALTVEQAEPVVFQLEQCLRTANKSIRPKVSKFVAAAALLKAIGATREAKRKKALAAVFGRLDDLFGERPWSRRGPTRPR